MTSGSGEAITYERVPGADAEEARWVQTAQTAEEGPSTLDPDEEQRKAVKARQAAALERMRAQQAEFAAREPSAALVNCHIKLLC